MFAGAVPDITDEEIRVVPLRCRLAADPSLAPALELEIGTRLWRDASDGAWHDWSKSDA